MKTNIVMLAAAIAAMQFVGGSAFAQSSTTTNLSMPTASDVPSAAGSSVAEAPAKPSNFSAPYLGILYGPALNSERLGNTYTDDAPFLNNRPSVQYNFNDNLNAGIQARFNLRFQNDGMDMVNDPWRLYTTIKNIYKDDVLQFNVLARAILPTRIKDHNRSMTVSPELLPILNITPKNSRFNLAVYPQLIRYLYTDSTRSAGSPTFIALGNFEGTYQLSGSTAITFGFYPEYVTTTDVALNNDSNELDLGVSIDVAKGWAINPFVAAEFVGMGANNASFSKNLAINMAITGAFL